MTISRRATARSTPIVLSIAVLAACSGRPSPAGIHVPTDEEIIALKPPGTNALILRAKVFGYGSFGVTPDPRLTCFNYPPEDNLRESQLCWAYLPIELTSVDVLATPENGYVFQSWVKGYCAGSSSGSCTIPMDTDRSALAAFANYRPPPPTTATLDVHVLGRTAGDIAVTPDVGLVCWTYDPEDSVRYVELCSEEVPVGTWVELRATARPGTVFAGWGGNCSGIGACSLVLDRDKGVTALFTSSPVQLSALVWDAGTWDGSTWQ